MNQVDVYRTLKDRIGMFENVVGPLQPILAEMPRIFRELAQGEIEHSEAIRQLEEARTRKAPAIAGAIEQFADETLDGASASTLDAPITQVELARWCLLHRAPGMRIGAVPEPGTTSLTEDSAEGCFEINWPYAPPHLGISPAEEVLVTFSGEIADRHPPTGPSQDTTGIEQPGREGVRLLTWGDPYLTAWLEAVRGETLTDADYDTAGYSRGTNPLR